MQNRSPAVAFAMFLALAAGIGASPAPPSSPPPSPFSEEIEVRVVNVEVVVTDAKGERVSGLAAVDFTLSVDGRPVAVEYFSEIRDGRPQAAPELPAGAPHDAGIQAPAAVAAGTNYLVYVDDYFAFAQQRDPVLAGLRASLDQLRPEDRMAIVSFDGARLTQLSGWSGSRSELAAAIDRAMAHKAHGLDRVVEADRFRREELFRSDIIDVGGRQGAAGSRPLDLNARSGALDVTREAGLNEAQRGYGSVLVRRVKACAGGAVSAMRAFAPQEGRKVLLLLAGGWPFSVRSLLAGDTGLPTQDLPEGDEVLRPLTDAANLLGYTIYPVDVPGAAYAGPDIDFSGPGAPTATPRLLQQEETEASLRFIAKETGGLPIIDKQRILALGSASADTRSFYWLGFAPSWHGDDRAHRLKVEVRRPGLSVRSRSGFLDLSRQAEVSMRLESALVLGTFPGALPMPIRLGEPKRLRPGLIELPVTLGLPVDLMTVVPVGDKFAVKLELRFAASAGSGATSQIPVVPITLTSSAPPRPGGFVRHQTTVTLRGPADHLVIAAYDPASDRMATAEVELALH